MKAAIVRQLDGHFHIEEVELGTPTDREVVVDVKASGLCHSDLHNAENDYGNTLPALFGHEVAGVVSAVGIEVTELTVGDHVVASLIQFCGHCKQCLSGRTYRCLNQSETVRNGEDTPRVTQAGKPISQVYGIGGFAEQILVHENNLVKVSAKIPFAQASLLGCGVITGAGAAINTAGIRPGDTVAVIGAGGVGLNVVQGARIAGAGKIISIDMNPAKANLAEKFGATDFVDASAQNSVEAVRILSGGGVDHAFEVVGLKPTAQQAVEMTGIGGNTYLIGMHVPGKTIELEVMHSLILGQRSVQGVLMGSTNIKNDIPMYAELYLQGRFNLDDLISREINISEINDAYDELRGGAIARSVITSF